LVNYPAAASSEIAQTHLGNGEFLFRFDDAEERKIRSMVAAAKIFDAKCQAPNE